MTVFCNGCGKPMIWVKTVVGKNMPLDVESKEKRFVIVKEEPNGTKHVKVWPTYLSHFATCPDADKFRKNKK